MMKQCLIVLVVSVLSAGLAGCTVSQASDRDRYGDYLAELNSGNTYFGMARAEYDAATRAFAGGFSHDAVDAMASACGYYHTAMEHYAAMAGCAGSPGQKAYADALKSYAQSCMYAASAYLEAYKAYDSGDRAKGDARFRDAAAYIAQANGYHDEAVRLQPMAVT